MYLIVSITAYKLSWLVCPLYQQICNLICLILSACTEKNIKLVLNEMEEVGDLPTPLKRRLAPNNSVVPHIYRLPKVHKEDVPLQPIVCTTGSATYDLAKELSRILSLLSGHSNSFIKNSHDFTQKTKDLKLGDHELTISFDGLVCSHKSLLMMPFR